MKEYLYIIRKTVTKLLLIISLLISVNCDKAADTPKNALESLFYYAKLEKSHEVLNLISDKSLENMYKFSNTNNPDQLLKVLKIELNWVPNSYNINKIDEKHVLVELKDPFLNNETIELEKIDEKWKIILPEFSKISG